MLVPVINNELAHLNKEIIDCSIIRDFLDMLDKVDIKDVNH